MELKTYKRHSAKIIKSKRWPALRLAAKRRDGWKCVQCGAHGRLEVDHIKPVRTHPDLAFELSNLQSLCRSCHSKKTRLEVGWVELSPARREWRDFVTRRETPKPEKGKNGNVGICKNQPSSE